MYLLKKNKRYDVSFGFVLEDTLRYIKIHECVFDSLSFTIVKLFLFFGLEDSSWLQQLFVTVHRPIGPQSNIFSLYVFLGFFGWFYIY